MSDVMSLAGPHPHPYPAYKPSGVEWRGDVPGHWEVVRLSAVSRPKSVVNQQHRELLSVYLNLGVIRFSDVNEKRTNPTSQDLSQYQAVDPGDVVLNNQQAWRGSVGVSNLEGIVSPAYLVLALSSRLDPNFADLLFRDKSMVEQYVICSKGVGTIQRSLYWPHLKRIATLVPPLPEQAAIVRYLDYADRRVRSYVRSRRKLIALLEEEKQAVVNQAVTRGLDPNVRLKPSGVEWLSDVPEHWDRCRLRNVVSVVTTGSRGWSSSASDTGPLFIRVANLNRGSLQLRFDDTVRLNLPETSEVTRTRIRAGDLLVSVTAYIGSVGLAPEELEEAYVSQHVARCQPLPGSSSRWLGYVLLSTVGQTHGQLSLYGGTKDGLSLDDVKNYQILLPPLDEQIAIVEHVDKATAEIDAAIGRARRQIELLREYRTRLIADVVTGKLDVRDAAAQIPDEIDDQDPIEESSRLADGLDEALYDIDESVEELAMESEVTV